MKQKLIDLQEETDKPTITVRFNTMLSLISRTSGQKISKDVDNLDDTLHQLSPIDVYRSHHPTPAYYCSLIGGWALAQGTGENLRLLLLITELFLPHGSATAEVRAVSLSVN